MQSNNTQTITNSEYEKLISNSFKNTEIKEKTITTGTVVKINRIIHTTSSR